MKRFTASLLLCMMPLTGQQAAQAPKPPADEGVVTFKSNTQLVIETVFVKDKSGKAVEGLTAKDFTLTENNVPQTIQFCEFQKFDDAKAPAAVAAAAVARPATVAVASVTGGQIAPEAPGDIRHKDHRMLALYFDMAAMPVPDQIRALAAAKKFIRTQMTVADEATILEYTGAAVKVLNDFTGDRDILDASIEKLIVGEGQGFDQTDTAADAGTAFGQDDAEFNIFSTDRQLAALQTAVKMLGTLNEKKSLVYFSSGLRLSGTNNQAQMQATVNAAIRANVSFFPVDARGLVASAPLGDATVGSPGGVGMYSGASAFSMASNFQKSQDTMYSLAADTGGKALLDNNDLAAGIVQAQQSISSYYILGYYTNQTALDGKFRRVKITVNDVNAKLDYRQGFYAGKTFSKFTTADKERQLEDALMLGDPITELTIAMEANYFQLNRAEYFVPVSLKIPGSELALVRKSGGERTLIDFIGEVKDEFGTTVSNVRDKVDIKLTGETAAELVKRPIQYGTGFTLLPGAYTMKFLARDDETGRIGTYMTKFVVPNLNKEDKRIPISSVVLSSQLVDRRDALFTATKDKDKGPIANPLIQNGQELMPNVTHVFSKNRDMFVYLQAYEPNATVFQPLIAFVTFYRGQTKAFETQPMQVSEGLPNRLKTMPLKFSLALNKLPPGRYDCQVTVLDPTGQKAAFWQAPIVLTQ